MGRDRGNKGGGGSGGHGRGAQNEDLTGGIVLDDAATKKLLKLDSLGLLNAMDQWEEARAIALALGLSFRGHKPHGANHSTPQTGRQVLQNLIDGVQGPKRRHMIHCIMQQTGIALSV